MRPMLKLLQKLYPAERVRNLVYAPGYPIASRQGSVEQRRRYYQLRAALACHSLECALQRVFKQKIPNTYSVITSITWRVGLNLFRFNGPDAEDLIRRRAEEFIAGHLTDNRHPVG